MSDQTSRPAASNPTARSLGSSGAALGGAKLYFLIASYATTLALTRIIDPATFGSYNAVARLITVPNMVIIYSLMFTVSRPMAAEFDAGTPNYRALRSQGVRLALGLGGLTGISFFLAAPALANWLSDPGIEWPIRVVAPISLIYALYAVNIGTLNATRRFGWQAGLDVCMATMKAGLIIVFAALGLGLTATLGGFTVAAGLAATLSVVAVRRARPRPSTVSAANAPAPMRSLVGTLVVFTAATNLLLTVDLFVLKHFAVDDAARTAVGFYSSAQLVALVPYSVLSAISLLVFPLIATIHASGDSQRVRSYVSRTLVVTVSLVGLMGSVAAAAAPEIMSLLFPGAYASAAADLRWMIWGGCGYSVAITSAWILNSAHRSRSALSIVFVGLVAATAAAWTWVPEQGNAGAAQAMALGGAVASLVALGQLAFVFGARVSLRHAAGLGIACAATLGVGLWAPAGELLAVVKLVALTVTFVGVVLATGTVRVAELKALRGEV